MRARTGWRLSGVVLGAVVVTTALTGCQGVANSIFPPSTVTPTLLTAAPPTAPMTPKASSTSARPVTVPSAAQQKTKAGSAAFTQFFWGQFNTSQMTPDPNALRSLYLDACLPCTAYLDAAEALQDNAQRYAQPPFVLKSVKADTLSGDTATVISTIEQQAAAVVDRRGATVGTATKRSPTFLVTLEWSGIWKVKDIQAVT